MPSLYFTVQHDRSAVSQIQTVTLAEIELAILQVGELFLHADKTRSIPLTADKIRVVSDLRE